MTWAIWRERTTHDELTGETKTTREWTTKPGGDPIVCNDEAEARRLAGIWNTVEHKGWTYTPRPFAPSPPTP